MAAIRSRHLPRNSSSESSDSSDDETPWKRRCDGKAKTEDAPFTNPLAGTQPPSNKVKKFNVWSSVLTDQTVTGELGGFDIVEDKKTDTMVSRGPESFRVTEEAINKLYPASKKSAQYEDLDAEDEDEMDAEDGEDSASGGGAGGSDDFLKMLNSYKKAKDEWEKTPKDLREKLKNKKRKNDLRGKISKNKYDRQNQRGDDFVYTSEAKFQSDVPRASATDSKEVILKCVMDTLQEQNEELFQTIIDNIPAETALDLLNKTEDVESAGGMMIKSGIRRRTPGGVFIQLLRQDPVATPELVKMLFPPPERNKQAESRRKKEAKRRRKRMAAAKVREGVMERLIDVNTGMDTGDVQELGESEMKTENGDHEAASHVIENESEAEAEDGEIVSD